MLPTTMSLGGSSVPAQQGMANAPSGLMGAMPYAGGNFPRPFWMGAAGANPSAPGAQPQMHPGMQPMQPPFQMPAGGQPQMPQPMPPQMGAPPGPMPNTMSRPMGMPAAGARPQWGPMTRGTALPSASSSPPMQMPSLANRLTQG